MKSGKHLGSASHVVKCYRTFTEIPEAVFERLSFANTGEFFDSSDWFSCLARHGFAELPSLRILVCQDNRPGDDHSYLFCLCEEAGRRRLTSLSNYYTIVYAGITGSGATPCEVAGSIVNRLASDRPAWSDIELRNLSLNDRRTTTMSSLFAGAGYRVDVSHQDWNWFVGVKGLSYADYLAERPARLRNTLHRRLGKAARSHEVRFEVYRGESRLPVGLADYQAVYGRSWKSAESPPGFVPELIRLCTKLGILRLGVLYLDARPVAAQFWICTGRVSFIYKLAHDPQFDSFSVGSLLTAHMFEQAIDVDKVEEIDFGVGDEAYKRDWTDSRRQLVGLQAVNVRTLRGRLLSLRLGIRDGLRRVGLRKYTPVRQGSPAEGDTQVS